MPSSKEPMPCFMALILLGIMCVSLFLISWEIGEGWILLVITVILSIVIGESQPKKKTHTRYF